MKKILSILFAVALVLGFSVVAATPVMAQTGPPVTSGLALHLDASDANSITKVGANKVSQWADLSGNNNHATQATSANQPLWVDNVLAGKPVIRFDGSNDYLETANPAFDNSHTVFLVIKAPDDTQINTALAQYSSGTTNRYNAVQLHCSPTTGAVVPDAIKSFLDPTGHFGAVHVINTTDWFLIGLRKDGTTDIQQYVDGALVNTKTSVAANVEQKALTIGIRPSGANPLDGDIAELLIYNRALSDGEREQVEQYLGIKWLATCHATETGTGTACFYSSNSTITGLSAVAEDSLPAAALATKPINFPDGLFSFNITGLSNGATVTVDIKLPPGSAPTQYWKYHVPEGWIQIPMTVVGPPNVIRITLKDGGLGDDDGKADGVIVDQGGPGSSAVGWETYPTNKVRVLLPWIALVSAIIAGATLLVLRRRRAQS